MPLTLHVFHTTAAPTLARLVSDAAPDRDVQELPSLDALVERLPEIEVLFAPMPPREGWAEAGRLRLIQLAGVGADHLLPSPDLPAAVEVAGLRGLFAEAVAEHVTMMALVLTRRLVPMIASAGRGEFRAHPVPRLAGRRVVVVGAGAIGRAVARQLGALGVDCVSVSRRGVAHPEFSQAFGRAGLTEALGTSDGVVVAVPLTPETRGLLSSAVLAAIPKGAFLIDVSRGGVVDEPSLLNAVSDGSLTLARDVFENEPLPPESAFFGLGGCLVTPHIAGYAEGYLEGAVSVLLDNVRRLERGEPRQRLVDRASNY